MTFDELNKIYKEAQMSHWRAKCLGDFAEELKKTKPEDVIVTIRLPMIEGEPKAVTLIADDVAQFHEDINCMLNWVRVKEQEELDKLLNSLGGKDANSKSNSYCGCEGGYCDSDSLSDEVG